MRIPVFVLLLTVSLVRPGRMKADCPVGDLNGDCEVNSQDLQVLAEQWLVRPGGSGGTADLNGDNEVGMADFALLAAHWYEIRPPVIISEFMAINGSKQPLSRGELLDEDGDSADWIEISNTTDAAVNLDGWYLTDSTDNLTRWEFPAVQINPRQFMTIFASGKDRDDPNGELHTNFKLAGSDGLLALVKPDDRTIVHAYSYPEQFGDVSYGLSSDAAGLATETILIPEFAPATALIPTDGSLGLNWTKLGFNDAQWLRGAAGVGYDYGSLIRLDVGEMRSVNQTVYVRVPFIVEDVSGIDELTLRMKYEDGFVAYLNGVVLDGDNAPGLHELTWNSGATAVRDDNIAVNFRDFDITAYKDSLIVGENVLAIHGLNAGLTSSDLLILPEMIATELESVDVSSTVEGYFFQPTPGQQNSTAIANLGPAIRNVTENPPPPDYSADLTITAEVTETLAPVAGVTLFYRVNFGAGANVQMFDDGLHNDGAANDNVYGAVIPATESGPGDMVRWKVVAVDSQVNVSYNPLFLLRDGRRQSPEYFGTVVVNPTINTPLPVFQYFVQNVGAAGSRTGTRASVFYLDEFYDNVFIRVRGGYTTQGRKFEFNEGHHFRFDLSLPRVDEINVNEPGRATNQQSPESTYMRQVLSWETYDNAGAPGSISFPMHIRRNGYFLDVRIFIEQQDRDFLRREGLDPDGALYKMYNPLTSNTSGVDKKTRRDEGNSDLQALVSGVSPGNPNRAVYLFDNINIPAVINYIAATTIMHENDHVQKNYFVYRDTEGTQEWMFLPWDKDLTFGRNWGISGIRASSDPYSHPLFGDSSHRKVDNLWNRLIDAIHDNAIARSMYLRRLRTLMDGLLQPFGTSVYELKFERRINQLQAMLDDDVASAAFYNEISKLKTDYLMIRRQHLFINHSINNPSFPGNAGIPNAQPDSVSINFGTIEFNPVSGNQDEEYIQLINPNPFAVDISGWRLQDGVEHIFPPGTVVPPHCPLYVTPNAMAFRNRAISPKGQQQLLVQGNYRRHLSSWGETINLIDNRETLVNTITYEGNPSDQQRYLRITEIMYHPADPCEGSPYPPRRTEAFEYIELRNIGTTPLSLNNVKFTEGIYYTFGSISLPAGDYLVVVNNQAAFESRYTLPGGVQILGPYQGQLSNGGEEVKLEDPNNSTILEFDYKDGWYDITDGMGFSLTVKDPVNTEPNAWDDKSTWRPSANISGSPGWDDADEVPALGSVKINEILAHSHAAASDWIELHNTTNEPIHIGGWFLSDDIDDLMKYEIADGTWIDPCGYIVFYQNEHFGNIADPGCHSSFALSENGETLYLHSSRDGVLTGYSEEEKFDASETGVAFGRYRKSTGTYNFVAMSENTPGFANAYPMLGPIVINEIMYHPQNNGDAEYVELLNISGGPIDLEQWDNEHETFVPWRFTDEGGISFDFPLGTIIAAGEYILLVRNLSAFESEFGAVDGGVQVFEWQLGKLDNGSEKIQLSKPGDEVEGTRYYIRVDRVNYSDGSHPVGDDPWPTEADGAGSSLSRKEPSDYGNDVVNWQAASGSPGDVNS